MKTIKLDQDAINFWDHLDAKQYRQIGRKITSLACDSPAHDAKALVNYSGVFRIDCGEYRIIYGINATTVEILLIGKRNDDEVYKKFIRKFHYKHNAH